MKPEGGSLADEMGSDAGWAAPHEDQQQKPGGGNEGLASSQDFTPVLRRGLKMVTARKCAPALPVLPSLSTAWGLGCRSSQT